MPTNREVPGVPGAQGAAEFRRLFAGLAAIGRDHRGGWTRLAWTSDDRAARDWFRREAEALDLAVRSDRNGNLWAWWGGSGSETGASPGSAVATGSHLDTVANGGAYDGALGVVSGLLAIRLLQDRRVRPVRPIAVAAFADEEGGRFGLATFGSRLAAGTLSPERVLSAKDTTGVTVADATAGFAVDLGPDPELLTTLAAYVELHVEQGRALADIGAPVAVGTAIWPHGRWRLTLTGEANHAGTTRLGDRRDPTLPLANALQAARRLAEQFGAVATIGRVLVEPNSTNSVPGLVAAWLDARAPDDGLLDQLVSAWTGGVERSAANQGVACTVAEESRSRAVVFDTRLADRLATVLERRGLPAPRLPTAAGHDAGALAAALPTAMLFVRNPTGASHSPAESATDDDCQTGVEVLADVLEELACR